MTDDEFTYMNITFMSITIREILEQYHTEWMPKELKKIYVDMIQKSSKLEKEADKELQRHRRLNTDGNIGRNIMAKAQVKEVAWGVYDEKNSFTGNTFPIKKEAVEYIDNHFYGYKVAKVFVTPFVKKK